MPFGFGYGRGFGFRGASPPWPYVGRGRGGYPRCAYPGLYTGHAYTPGFYGGRRGMPYYGDYPAYGNVPYTPGMGRTQELDVLREEANAVKAQLDEIEARIKDLEGEEE